MHKIETHLHTNLVSACGWLSPEEILAGYKKKGYDAITVTDHFHRGWLDSTGIIPGQGTDIAGEFLRGYSALHKLGKEVGIKIYYGAELRFDENDNDYLLLGYKKELLNHADEIFRMGIGEFSKIARQTGMLIIQAHPYRIGSVRSVPADPSFLDGVEAYNANVRHFDDNFNDKAMEFAKENRLIMLAGSDCHRLEDIGVSGILSDTLPEDSFSYARLIRSRNFSIIK